MAKPGQILALTNSPDVSVLQRLHLRVYAGEDYASRWDHFFNWPPANRLLEKNCLDARAELQALLARHGVKRKAVAAALRIDPSTLTKILNGKRRCPPELLEAARLEHFETFHSPACKFAEIDFEISRGSHRLGYGHGRERLSCSRLVGHSAATPHEEGLCQMERVPRPTSNQTAVEGLVEVLPRSRHRRDLWAAKQDSGG